MASRRGITQWNTPPSSGKMITASSKHCNKHSEQLWAVHVRILSWCNVTFCWMLPLATHCHAHAFLAWWRWSQHHRNKDSEQLRAGAITNHWYHDSQEGYIPYIEWTLVKEALHIQMHDAIGGALQLRWMIGSPWLLVRCDEEAGRIEDQSSLTFDLHWHVSSVIMAINSSFTFVLMTTGAFS